MAKLRDISEMASLKGWHPTDQKDWLAYINGEEADIVKASDEAEAIQIAMKEFGISDPNSISVELSEKSEYYANGNEAFLNLRQNDLKSINSDSTKRKIEGWLNNNNTPYEWIFYFGEEHDAKPTPGAITFFKTGNAGGDVLTPHMILHTVGHAVVSHDPHLEKLFKLFAEKYLFSTRSTDDKAALFKVDTATSTPRLAPESKVIDFICKFLHMKAAKNTLKHGYTRQGFPTINEIVNELAGIYVKNGKVKFEPNEYYDLQIDPQVIDTVRLAIDSYFKTTLDNLVGKVIYDE